MRKLSIVLLLSFFLPSVAVGELITYLSQDRYIQETFYTGEPFEFDPVFSHVDTIFVGGFWFFDAATTTSDQQSRLNPDSLVATGSTEGFYGPPVGSSQYGGASHFEATFLLSEPADYALNLMTEGHESAHIRFWGPSLSIDEVSIGNPTKQFMISESGILEAGEYEVLVSISNGAATEGFIGRFDLDFQITAIPEPDSFVACVFLALGLITLRRREKRRSDLGPSTHWSAGCRSDAADLKIEG